MTLIYSVDNGPFDKSIIEQYNDNELPPDAMKHIKKVQKDIENLIDE